ncbi:hypothetical protein BC831DRAFT_112090 [Entophlyctis helioformis]|nr:hypothetical protein BC831DRAFT_112090 [Entophlyctis helioformis]
MQVLGGANENVFITYKRADGTLGPRIKAIYRRPRDGTPYSYYGLHIPNITTFDQGRGISAFGAVAVRPAGESIDINQGIWFKADFPIGCKANLTFPEDPFVFVMPPATTTVAPSSTTAVPSASTGSAVIGVATTIAGDKPAYPSNSPVTEPTTEEPGVYASSAVGLLSGVVGSVVSAALGWMALF